MNTPLFGANIDPNVTEVNTALAIAQLADQTGLDMVLCQDHPYHKDHLDTWTLITTVAAQTERVHIGTNVANLPLRTPTMLAKMAASLDVISGGRLELGLGAGAFWKGILAYGGREDLQDKPFTAFKESLDIIQGMWANSDGNFRYEGTIYTVKGMRPGPAPAHPIRIWVGGYGPKMLRLIGAQGDGVNLSSTYISYPQLTEVNKQIDAGAQAAGRDPDAVRRLYNVMGVITSQATSDGFAGKTYAGTIEQWIDHLVMLYQHYRQDTFVYWPTEGDFVAQMQRFAEEVVPGVRQAVDAPQ